MRNIVIIIQNTQQLAIAKQCLLREFHLQTFILSTYMKIVAFAPAQIAHHLQITAQFFFSFFLIDEFIKIIICNGLTSQKSLYVQQCRNYLNVHQTLHALWNNLISRFQIIKSSIVWNDVHAHMVICIWSCERSEMKNQKKEAIQKFWISINR